MKYLFISFIIALLFTGCTTSGSTMKIKKYPDGTIDIEYYGQRPIIQFPQAPETKHSTPSETTPSNTDEGEDGNKNLHIPAQIALVIGNSQYEYNPLYYPTKNASAMANVLRQQGFEVRLEIDLKKSKMKQAIREFGQHLAEKKGSVGLFYYAGHGVQINKNNYLVPINNKDIRDDFDVEDDANCLAEILQRMVKGNNGVNIVILDAAHNNPFESSNGHLVSGLAQTRAETNMLIAFATRPNETTTDNWLYTQHLVEAIQMPGTKIEEAFKQVGNAVNQASNGEQVPSYNGSIIDDYCFGGCLATPK